MDTNGDDLGDTVVPGATLLLLDEEGNPVLDQDGKPRSTTTDSNGEYEFADLLPGRYTVVHQLEDGFTAITPSTVEVNLPPGTDGEAHFVIEQSESGSRIVRTYCRTILDINPMRNVPSHHSGAWTVISATSGGKGRVQILSDGYIRYRPTRDFLRDTSDTITLTLRAPDGTTITRTITVGSFGAIAGRFQSLLTTDSPLPRLSSPAKVASADNTHGLININLSASAVVSGQVRLEGETLSFRGGVTGGVSFVKLNSKHGKNHWDISLVYSEETGSWAISLKKHGGATYDGTGIRALKNSILLAGQKNTFFGESELGQADFGSGRIVIGKKANVRIIGMLDGARRAFTSSAAILENFQIPYFQKASIGGDYGTISLGGALFMDAPNASGWFEGNGWITLDPASTMGQMKAVPRMPYDLWIQPQP